MKLAVYFGDSIILRIPEIHYKSCIGCHFKISECKLPRKELGLTEFACEGYIWVEMKQNGLIDGN